MRVRSNFMLFMIIPDKPVRLHKISHAIEYYHSSFNNNNNDNDDNSNVASSFCLSYTVKANSAFNPSGVGKWVPASAGKAKAGMVHSVSGWTRGVQIKLWDPLRTRAMPERLRRCVHDEALYKSTFTFTFTFNFKFPISQGVQHILGKPIFHI